MCLMYRCEGGGVDLFIKLSTRMQSVHQNVQDFFPYEIRVILPLSDSHQTAQSYYLFDSHFIVSVPQESCDGAPTSADPHTNTYKCGTKERPSSQLLLSSWRQGKAYHLLLTRLYPCLLFPQISGNLFINGFWKTSICSFLTGWDRRTWRCRSQGWKGHLSLTLNSRLYVTNHFSFYYVAELFCVFYYVNMPTFIGWHWPSGHRWTPWPQRTKRRHCMKT